MALRHCEFCQKTGFETNRSFGQHQAKCSHNPNRSDYYSRPRRPETWKRQPLCGRQKRTGNQHTEALKTGVPYKVSEATREKLRKANANKVMSEETKRKISVSRRAYLEANPDKVPYLMNHYSKGPSYPETYFDGILSDAGLTFTKEHRIGLYSLDFAFLDQMIDLEINGGQHYTDPRIVESDKRRKAYLENKGWSQIVVNWPEYKTLDLEMRTAVVAELIDKLRHGAGQRDDAP